MKTTFINYSFCLTFLFSLCLTLNAEAKDTCLKSQNNIYQNYKQTTIVANGQDILCLEHVESGKLYRLATDLQDLTPKIEALDLSTTKLSQFPSIIFQHPQLKIILLGHMASPKSIPTDIGKLKNLQILSLVNTKLIHLPKEIGQLKNLKFLDLSHNDLIELPKEIGQLKQLTHLNLSNNNLIELPKKIGQLTNLISLFLTSNQLKDLPKEIGQLTNLELLKLGNNTISTLPDEIGSLIKLKKLLISGNALCTLPKKIGQLKSLKFLDVSGIYKVDNKNSHGCLIAVEYIPSNVQLDIHRLLIAFKDTPIKLISHKHTHSHYFHDYDDSLHIKLCKSHHLSNETLQMEHVVLKEDY